MTAKACPRGTRKVGNRYIEKPASIVRWKKHFKHIVLDTEIYPDKLVPRDFFILTRKEISDINRKTKERIKRYNEMKPKEWAGYE